MAGDQPSAGYGPQNAAGGPGGGVPPRPGVDPAAVADQLTQLDGAAIPAQAAPPVAPPGAGAAPGAPGGPSAPNGADLGYQPTAPAFPAQSAPPAPGAPVGPYDPAAGAGTPAYGYPQAAPPSYGYPQQDAGYPAPPQQPFAQPAQPFAQPAPQPAFPYPGPTQGAPAKKERNPVMVFGAIAGSVLAIAIVIGLVVLFNPGPHHNPNSTGGPNTTGGPGPDDSGKLVASWSAPKLNGDASSLKTIGEWATSKLLIRGDSTGLTAYNLSDGTQAWQYQVPDGTKALCSMSKNLNKNNVGAITFNLGDNDCAAVGAIDATTGKLLFKAGSPLSNKSFNTTVTIGDNTLAAASGGLLAGYNLSDGSQAWVYKDRGQYCNDQADTGGNVVVVSDYCSDTSNQQQLMVLDATTGKTTQTFNLGQNERLSNIVSVKPLVVQISSNYDNDYFVGIDSSGNAMAKIPLKVTGADRLQLSGFNDPTAKSLVIGNTLYVEVQNSDKTAIEAIDLASGKSLWTQDGGAEMGLHLVDWISTSDPAPRAIAMDGFEKGARVLKLNPADGTPTTYETFSTKASSDDFISMQDSEVMMNDGGEVLQVPALPTSDAAAVLYAKKN
ncbi:PQQ-binding-like beta-propeller repeat protein [Kitasatospora sp. LaBMicrA B282]|uniref:outer membrane protein assembly factor BamB family protein n=1 Tax=Kitasatospora sp. LaBMicrA B282 TaxID=3420949 RepID=UPI003D111544